jgi:hypothetical protein
MFIDDEVPTDPRERERFYALRRVPGRTYVYGTFRDDPERKRYAIRVWDTDDAPRFVWQQNKARFVLEGGGDHAEVRREAVLRTDGEGAHRYQIKATVVDDTRDVRHVVIQKYTKASGKPHAAHHVSMTMTEVEGLLKFFRALRLATFPETGVRYDDDLLDEMLSDEAARLRLLRENPRLADLLRADLGTGRDVGEIVALIRSSELTADVLQAMADSGLDDGQILQAGHRQRQLEVFRQLLESDAYFEARQAEWGCRGREAVWQRFFEDNTWILGYGLRYQFGAPLEGRKLEQVVAGYDVAGSGKRTDALLKTLGIVNTLCFVEFKTARTPLLTARSYRPEVFPPSSELAGAVAQVQGTVQASMSNLQGEVLQTTTEDGFDAEILHAVTPKALVVCGRLDEFIRDGRPHRAKIRSFELYRRSLSNPEILTFDELYERARFIVGDARGARPERAGE